MPELPPIYNSRILKLYVEFLQTNYPAIDIEPILHYADISKCELDDPGHWFNQQHVDRFYTKVVELTGSTSIARDVGRFAASADASGAVRQRIFGLLRVSSIYMLLTKLYPLLSRGAEVTSRKLSPNCTEIRVVPYPHVQESAHQCENRMGFFEAMAIISTDKLAEVEHTECFHKGDACCRYRVTWQEPGHRRWRRLFLVSSMLVAAVVLPSFFLISFNSWLILLLAGSMGLMSICLRAFHLQTRDLSKKIQKQGNAAEDYIKEVDYRYRGALLVQKIGQATSMILNVNELARVIVQNIEYYLDFDRGLIMLADAKKKRLEFAAGYGFDEQMTDLLKNTQFRLDQTEAKGVFIQTYHRQRAVLVDDLDVLQDSLSEKSRKFASEVGSKSLICLPIVYEGQSLGILAVDNIITKRPLTQSDLNLLMGVAYQTAVSIFSANAFKDLQQSEERFRSLYENAPIAYISIRTDDAAIVNCNTAAIELLGHERRQLIGSSLMDHVASDQESRSRFQRLHELLQDGQSVRNESLQFVHRSGHCVWGNVALDAFKDLQGRVIEGRCIIIDTTEQTKLEEQLKHAQRMETIGTLAGGVAHDLSNILSAIVSYPELLLMDIEPDSSLYDPLKKMKSAGRRAAAIVQDLMTLARRGVPVEDVVMVNDVIKEYLTSPEFDDLQACHPQIKVEHELDAALPAIKGSEMHVTKMLMNILLNSAEAMPDGGTIRIATHCETVLADDPRANAHNGMFVVLSVTDDGYGIAPNDVHRVFEPFFTTKRMGRSGTGLGMAVVWAGVQDLKGFIDIDSQLGRGTTVHMYIPATAEQLAAAPKPTMRIDEFKGRGEIVLLVEDDTEHREIAGRMLLRLGYQVIAVGSGEAALEEMKRGRPDLVMLDMLLGPGLDGLDTYRKMLDLHPQQRIIIASGFAETSRVKMALELGAGAYIKKPFSLNEIGVAVRLELDR